MNRDELEGIVWESFPVPKVKDIREVCATVDKILAAVDAYVLGVCGWSEARRARVLREATPQAAEKL